MRRLLEELFAAYYADVYHYLYSLSRDAALSEDLASEVFLEVVKSIATFRGESDVRTWLFTIARRRWYAHLKWKGRQIPAQELTGQELSPDKLMDEWMQDRELAQTIQELLRSEPERTRSIVWMRAQGYSYYEIGQKLGISESSARVIYFRARARIRQILKKAGFDHDENQL